MAKGFIPEEKKCDHLRVGKEPCVICGGDRKTDTKDPLKMSKAFRTGWSIIKAKTPRFCPMCMSSELELDTKEDNLRELKEGRGSYRFDRDPAYLRREEQKIMQGPNYWGYCLDCDYEMEG
jgi:hypothetical protein